METISERLNCIIREKKITKSEFARQAGISPQAMNLLCNGTNRPSEQTMRIICEKYRVRREWLETGEGDMFVQQTRSERIVEFMTDVLKEEEETFRRRVVEAMTYWNDQDWDDMERLARKLAKKED